MQLKQRLKKIEQSYNTNNPESEFCGCENTEEYRRAWEDFFNNIDTDKEGAMRDVNYSPNLKTGCCEYCKKRLSFAQTKFLENVRKQYDAEHGEGSFDRD